MCDTPIKIDVPRFDGFEDARFSHDVRACECGGFGSRTAFRCDDTDSEIGSDGVGESETIADYGAVSGSFETDVEFVFTARGGAANFCCAEVSNPSLVSVRVQEGSSEDAGAHTAWRLRGRIGWHSSGPAYRTWF